MAEGFISFLLIALASIATWLFMSARVILLREKLKKKDELIETMILSLPKLLGKDQKAIGFVVLATVSPDTRWIKVMMQCNDHDFVGKLYRYLSSLQQYGYVVTVDYLNGTTKFRPTK